MVIEVFLDECVEMGDVLAVNKSVVDADGYGHSTVGFHLSDIYQREVVAASVLLGG